MLLQEKVKNNGNFMLMQIDLLQCFVKYFVYFASVSRHENYLMWFIFMILLNFNKLRCTHVNCKHYKVAVVF